MTERYTRCPECRTVFTVSSQQLQQRDGLVRCGRCETVFQASQHFVRPKKGKTVNKTGNAVRKPVEPELETASPGTAGVPPPAEPTTSDQLTATPPSTSPRPDASAPTATIKEEVETADADYAVPTSGGSAATPLPTIAELIHGRHHKPWPAWMHFSAIIFLVLVLLGQGTYFYRNVLAQHEGLAPYVIGFCKIAACRVTPRQDVGLVELTDTRVTPHKKFEKALSVRATLINRARFKQPFPLIEVTLTDSQGQVITRKRFSASQYLPKKSNDLNGLTPNVAVKTHLEITSPDTQAEGYEIRLLPSA